MNKFEYFCWIWNFKNRFYASQFEHGENYYFVRLEDLSQEPESSNNLKKLLCFSGFPETRMNLSGLTKQKVNITTKKKFPTWKNWNKRQAKTLDKYCGELMRIYGYGNEDDWKSKLLP
jgi:hypothetical protein